MKYGIVYGRKVGLRKEYMEVYLKKRGIPELFDSLDEAEARIKFLAKNPIAHGEYKVKEISDEDVKRILDGENNE